MDFVQHMGRSERDDSVTNVRATETDVEFAMVILGIFALVALIF